MRLAWLPLIALCAATAARADEPTRLVAHFTRADPAKTCDHGRPIAALERKP